MRTIKYLLPVLLLWSVTSAFSQSTLDALHYRAAISFDLTNRVIQGDEIISIRNAGAASLDTVILHVRDVIVSNVEAGGNALGYAQISNELHIGLKTALAANDSIDIHIVYSGTPTNEGGNTPWGGFQWGPPTTYAMGVAFHAPYVSMTRHWLPSNDIPSDKATFDMTFDVPEGYVVAGTGLLESVQHNGGRAQYRWFEPHQTATYLVTFAVSQYAVVKDTWKGIPLEYYVAKTDSAHAVSYFATVPAMMEAFTKAFGPYPFDKVGYCMTEIGSMEHQTMISYSLSLLSAATAGDIAAHELSHQWWGDWVTPKDFREAWLSEGFATFSQAVYAEYLNGYNSYLVTMRTFNSNYRNQDALYEGMFPLYDFPRANPSSNYPSTIYDKGACVLGMLRYVIGDSAFFTGLKNFGQHNAYGSGTTDNFRAEIEASSGQTLDWFFDEWVIKAGYPSYTLQRLMNGPDDPFRLRILQAQDSAKYPFFRMPIDVAIVKTTGDTARFRIENHAQYTEDFSFPSVLNRDVQSYLIDPTGIILKKTSYRTLGVDPAPETGLLSFHLEQNYPNPWVKSSQHGTVIPFSLDQSNTVTLELFDSIGRKVTTLASGVFPAGEHQTVLSDSTLPCGTYTLRLRVNSDTAVRNLVVVR